MECPECNGEGCQACDGLGIIGTECPECGGTGLGPKGHPCVKCLGEGRVGRIRIELEWEPR